QEAAAVVGALDARESAMEEAMSLVTDPPSVLAQASDLGLKAWSDASRAWTDWAAAGETTSGAALADHLEKYGLELANALTTLRDEAAAELNRREDAWRPVNTAIV